MERQRRGRTRCRGPAAGPRGRGPARAALRPRRARPWRDPSSSSPGDLGAPPELRLQLGDGVRQDRRVPAPLHGEAERPVERRQVARPEPPGLPLAQPHPGHALRRPPPRSRAARRRPGRAPSPGSASSRSRVGVVHQRRRVEGDAGAEEVVPAVDPPRAARGSGARTRLGRQRGQRAARAPPQLVQLPPGPAGAGPGRDGPSRRRSARRSAASRAAARSGSGIAPRSGSTSVSRSNPK